MKVTAKGSQQIQKTLSSDLWPALPYDQWKETLDTLHMWMQIPGKVMLELCPFLNQWWEVAFQVGPTGMTTGRIPYKDGAFSVDFNFVTHTLSITTSRNQTKMLRLSPRSVADFYSEFMMMLKMLDIHVSIYPVPAEFANPIPFHKDTQHASYDAAYVEKWWRIQLNLALIFDRFRSSFRGKSSPIHFFWGSFDLNGTRFNGRPATPPPLEGALGRMMAVAENEENFSFGFWPGDERFPYPALYAYLYPAPKGFETIQAGPPMAYYHQTLAEYILPYEAVRETENPDEMIMAFLETTYRESASLAGWDISTLESNYGASVAPSNWQSQFEPPPHAT